MSGFGWRRRLGPAVPVAPAARVDRFEIFFDLVFVFSFFIITRSTARDVSGGALLHALLVLAVLWWSWVVHSVVATRVRLGEGFVPVLMTVGMAALFTFALSLPQAFHDVRGNAAGPVVAAVSYIVVRLVHLLLLRHAVRDRPDELRQMRRFAPELVGSTLLLLAAALIPPAMHGSSWAPLVRDGLWALVVLLQYTTGQLVGSWVWGIASAEHWTERYDLILIIALGESVISVGVGSNLIGQPPTLPAVGAAVLSIFFTAALWWAHYDMVGPAARIALHSAQGKPRLTMARDAYAYCYLPMIAGIILFALGAEQIVHQITSPTISDWAPARGSAEPLLFGGVFLYLLGDMLFQLRTLHTLSWTRVVTLGLLAICPPLVDQLPALGTLGLLTVICVGMVAAEVVIFDEGRRALRRLVFEERTAHEAHEAAYRARWHEPNEPDEGE
ncbi:low temperature requirement protein A [Micromonospora sp. DR5-3]|uniref:low temperature requirement protein A n=1 Tax=unclassified Micromonospora TaxID=2617518 RepID=UPI0011D3F7B0|nr:MULTISPECIES: low temperature requirement protein A [unclassified Micromonospora]MCW3814245.1 low temperature requirement protein A [Micromonospora sp. DR5-3]TYC25114.1 low temperature requirement protein A [Micromonospora sp. MP36]